ncbi:ATP12 family protein [Rhodospirillaceae bacterium SYSU D60014]|uniref:ATP12 family chaperone protein n=1 Tax=Virgifigura deserti TaxID=2268457 RepID=UPI000E671A0C
MKRFYKKVRTAAVEDGFQVLLDERPVRTPGRAPLVVPTQPVAEAIATEWQAQGEAVKPLTMPLTRLATTAIDRVTAHREGVIDEVASYAATDLLCYRADQPAELVARQNALWQPLLDWATLRYDAPLTVTTGVLPQPQPAGSLVALRAAVAALGTLKLTALHAATTACGSVIIALALLEDRIDAVGAWETSQLDETFQIEVWGEDAEAAARREALRQDIEATARFMALLRGHTNGPKD